MKDIRETGPLGLKGIRLGKSSLEVQDDIDAREYQELKDAFSKPIVRNRTEVLLYAQPTTSDEGIGDTILDSGYGKSTYDSLVDEVNRLGNLLDLRAESLGSLLKLANGIMKGLSLAGTTFADGTIGLIAGGLASASRGEISGLWDNCISNGLQEWNNMMEEVLPNYRSTQEDLNAWYQNLGTVNFWADTFLKNMGFTLGSMYASLAWLALGGAGYLGYAARFGTIGAELTGSVLAGVNEARAEANNNSDDWEKLERQKVDDLLRELAFRILGGELPQGMTLEDAKVLLEELRQRLYQDISERKKSVGLIDFIGNAAFLSLDNLSTFGKFFSLGFGNATKLAKKSIEGVTKDGLTYTAEKLTKKQGALKGLKHGVVEGNEELFLKAIAEYAGNLYEADGPDAYFKAAYNNEAIQTTNSGLSSAIKALLSSYGNLDSYEEFAVGFLTGALGTPVFGKSNTLAEDTYLGRGSSIGLRGGIFGEMATTSAENLKRQEAADYMTNYMSKFKDNLKLLVMSNAFTLATEGAAKDGRKFDWQNYKDNEDFVAIQRFANYGRLDDIRLLVNLNIDLLSNDELSTIAKLTTADPDNLKDKANGWKNPDGSSMATTEEGRAKMKEKLKKKQKEILKNIDLYEDAVTKLDDELLKHGYELSNDHVNELSWLKWKAGKFTDRYNDLIKTHLLDFLNLSTVLGDAINLSERDLIDAEKDNASDEVKSTIEKTINSFKRVRDICNDLYRNRDAFQNKLNVLSIYDNPKSLAYIKEFLSNESNGALKSNFENIVGGKDVFDTLLSDINDAGLLLNANRLFTDKLDEYLKNPEKLVERDNKAKEEVEATQLNVEAQQTAEQVNKTELQDLNKTSTDTLKKAKDALSQVQSPTKELQDALDKINTSLNIQKQASDMLLALNNMLATLSIPQELYRNTLKLIELASKQANNILEFLDPEVLARQDEEMLGITSELLLAANDLMTKLSRDILKAALVLNNIPNDVTTVGEGSADDLAEDTTGIEGDTKAVSVQQQVLDLSIPTVDSLDLPLENYTQEDVEQLPINIPSSDKCPKELSGMMQKVESNLAKDLPLMLGAWKPSTAEVGYGKNNNKAPFWENEIKEGNPKGTYHKLIWEYLYQHQAWKNVFNLKASTINSKGSRIRFMVDTEFLEQFKDLASGDYKQFPIFMIDDNNNIVGDLPLSIDASFNKNGIKDFTQLLYNEYINSDKPKVWISKYQTNVNLKLIGKVAYSDTVKTLNDTFVTKNSSGENTSLSFKLGVTIGDSVEAENKNGESIPIFQPLEPTNGLPYLLIDSHTSRGHVAVPFLMDNFSLNNLNSLLGKEIVKTLNKLSSLESTQLKDFRIHLSSLLNLHTIVLKKKNNDLFLMSVDPLGNKRIIYKGALDNPNIADIALENILTLNPAFVINRKTLNRNFESIDGTSIPYNLMIGELATVNLNNPDIISSWFTADPLVIDDSGKVEQIKAVTIQSTNNNPNAKPKEVKEPNPTVTKLEVLLAVLLALGGVSLGFIDKALLAANSLSQAQLLAMQQASLQVGTPNINLNSNAYQAFAENKISNATEVKNKPVEMSLGPKVSNIPNISIPLLPKGFAAVANGTAKFEDLPASKELLELKLKKLPLSTPSMKKCALYLLDNYTAEFNTIVNLKGALALNIIKALASTKYFKSMASPSLEVVNKTAFKNALQDSINKYKGTQTRFMTTKEWFGHFNAKKELNWLQRVLPLMNREEALTIQDNLIRMAYNGKPIKAFGMFKNGLITISKKGARGVLYHEAFHSVVHTLMSEEEYNDFILTAKDAYHLTDDVLAEEAAAEAFRKYTVLNETPILGKLLRLFKKLLRRIHLCSDVSPLEDLFNKINQGKYAQRILNECNYLAFALDWDNVETSALENWAFNRLAYITDILNVISPKEVKISDFKSGLGLNTHPFVDELKAKGLTLKQGKGERYKVFHKKGQTFRTEEEAKRYLDSKLAFAKPIIQVSETIDGWQFVLKNPDSLKEMIDEYRELARGYAGLLYNIDEDYYTQKMISYEAMKTSWNNLSLDERTRLLDKGWTKEAYMKADLRVRRNALYCY